MFNTIKNVITANVAKTSGNDLASLGKSVTQKFTRMDISDQQRLICKDKDGSRVINVNGAWYELGHIMDTLEKVALKNGKQRISPAMLKSANIDTISKERRRDGKELYQNEIALNAFLKTNDTTYTSVTALLKAFRDSNKEEEPSKNLTAHEIAAQAIKIANAHNVEVVAVVWAIRDQVVGTLNDQENVA